MSKHQTSIGWQTKPAKGGGGEAKPRRFQSCRRQNASNRLAGQLAGHPEHKPSLGRPQDQSWYGAAGAAPKCIANSRYDIQPSGHSAACFAHGTSEALLQMIGLARSLLQHHK